MTLNAGETALIREGNVLRWIRVVLAAPAQGEVQRLRVIDLDTPSKPRPVTLGRGNVRVERVS